MNRRKFGVVGGGGLAVVASGLGTVRPAQAAANASLLTTTLTPFGAERAGNADGSIPAWTGGLTEIPAGWTPSQGLMPDFFAEDKKIVSIDASNMEQYKDRLAEGVMQMMTKHPDYRIDVYPTHRTFSAPQWVYDNAVKNVSTAVAAPQGAKYGVTGTFGAIAWPILDPDPAVAGAQAMINHNLLYQGEAWSRHFGQYLMDENGTLTLAEAEHEHSWYTYYQPVKPDDYDGIYQKAYFTDTGPPNLVGQAGVYDYPVNTYNNPERIWEYLPGQGRVREAPNLVYDTPDPTMEDYSNMDEYAVFDGALDRYDWKLIGKKEMYVPYNNNKLILSTAEEGHQHHSLNPDLVRWELHRVWIVEATLSPGQRNVLAKRRFYLDEDSWVACLGDSYDAQGNYWRHAQLMIENRPDIPVGVMPSTTVLYDLQANRYATLIGIWNQAPYNQEVVVGIPPRELFNPQAMAAQAQF